MPLPLGQGSEIPTKSSNRSCIAVISKGTESDVLWYKIKTRVWRCVSRRQAKTVKVDTDFYSNGYLEIVKYLHL